MARKKNASKKMAADTKEVDSTSNPNPSIDSESEICKNGSNNIRGFVEDKWTLDIVFSIDQLQSNSPPTCQEKDCYRVACAQWLSSSTRDTWNGCIDCIHKHFGGWPQNVDDYPIAFVSEDHRRIMKQLCSKNDKSETSLLPLLPFTEQDSLADLNASKNRHTSPMDIDERNEDTSRETSSSNMFPNEITLNQSQSESQKKKIDQDFVHVTSSPSGVGDEEEEKDQVEQWDIKHIFTVEELLQNNAQKCGSKKCPLLACSAWVSSENEEWNGCLDCQEEYYERWPENASEYPISFMTVEHRELIWEKCTGKYKPDMPKLPLTDGGSMDDLYEWEKSHGIGNFRGDNTDFESDTHSNKEGENRNGLKHLGTNEATRTPPAPTVVNKFTAEVDNSWVTPSPVPPGSKKTVVSGQFERNKHHLQLHEKWQKEADKLGGGKIIVNKDEAKSIIFTFVRDQFRPMNITEIYNGLKAVVPNQMVKMCLDDMALDHFTKESQFIESDDEDADVELEKVKKRIPKEAHAHADIYAGSLCLKKGRNANTSLYYADQKKLLNDGNGLLPEDRNELYSNHANVLAEKAVIENTTMLNISEANRLLSQLSNIDMTSALTVLEDEVTELRSQIDAANEYKNNEKSRKLLLKKIDVMQAQWRKRRRLCLDFLSFFEEVTEGTVSMKKSLEGGGPIELESDEVAIKSHIAFKANKRKRQQNAVGSSLGGNAKRQKSEFVASESFVGVELTSSGIKRVFLNE